MIAHLHRKAQVRPQCFDTAIAKYTILSKMIRKKRIRFFLKKVHSKKHFNLRIYDSRSLFVPKEMCLLVFLQTHARNVHIAQTNKDRQKSTGALTPFAAAICTMTLIAVWLKKRPSPPTITVEPWRSLRSMEEKILWMKLCR